jgi:hypothetical protein
LIYALLLLFKTSLYFLIKLIKKFLLFNLKIIVCLIFFGFILFFRLTILFILLYLIIMRFVIVRLLTGAIYSLCLFQILKKLKFKFFFTGTVYKIGNIAGASPTWWRTTDVRSFICSLILYFRNLFRKWLALFILTYSLAVLLIIHGST